VQPGMHGGSPCGGGFEGRGVGPLADAGLDKPLGLAVGLRGVGPGALVGHGMAGECFGKALAAVGGAVVGHDALGDDAMRLEPGQCSIEEGHGTLLPLIGQHGGEGQARGVVDGDVQVLPAGAALIALAGAVAGDAVADAVDPAELLDVNVDQLARMLALVADDGRLGLEGGEAVEADAAQRQPDRRAGQAKLAGDGRTGPALAAQRLDAGGDLGGLPRRAVVGSGRAVAQPGLALGGRAVAPLADGPRRGAQADSHLRNALPLSQPADDQHSTMRRRPGILMRVHPGLRAGGCWLRNRSFPT
jgi:hypothetical protein